MKTYTCKGSMEIEVEIQAKSEEDAETIFKEALYLAVLTGDRAADGTVLPSGQIDDVLDSNIEFDECEETDA